MQNRIVHVSEKIKCVPMHKKYCTEKKQSVSISSMWVLGLGNNLFSYISLYLDLFIMEK